jgi:hypothetical protein
MAKTSAPIAKGKRVDGAQLLTAIAEFIDKHVVCTPEQRDAMALWVIHTHAFNAAHATPYLWITAPEIESGKTLLLETLQLLVAKPWLTGRVTASSLVRQVHAEHPTLLLDESDVAFRSGSEYAEVLRGVLNSGYRRRSAKFSMSVPMRDGGWRPETFDVFSPKAIAGIGGNHVPDSVLSRSVQIRLKRKLASQQVYPLYDATETAESLRKRISRWTVAHGETLAQSRPERLDGLGDRAFEVWTPLFAIADVALGEWPQRARIAAVALSSHREANVQSLGIQLLADIREIIGTTKGRLPSASLVLRLKAVEGAPWADFRGAGLNTHTLAQMLKPYEIEPRAFNTSDDGWFRGYARDDFDDAFARYLPPLSVPKGKKGNKRNADA